MIIEAEKPVWFDYIELDNNLNQILIQDAPKEVKEAYEQHLKEIASMNKKGEMIYKA